MKPTLMWLLLLLWCESSLAQQASNGGEESLESLSGLSTVVFNISDSIGQKRAAKFSVYDGMRSSIGNPKFEIADFKRPVHFVQLLKEKLHPMAVILSNSLTHKLQDEIELCEPNELIDEDLIQRVAEALNDQLNNTDLFDPAKFTDTKSREELVAILETPDNQTAARDPRSVAALNRLLIEKGFPGDFTRCNPFCSSENGVAEIGRGVYWLVTEGENLFVERGEIQSGKPVEIVAHEPRGIWLEFENGYGQPTKSHLFVPRSRQQMRQTLSQLRFPQLYSSHFALSTFMLRPDVKPEVASAARQAALLTLPQVLIPAKPPANSSTIEIIRQSNKRQLKLEACQKILAVTGTRKDVEQIIEQFDLKCGIIELHKWSATISRIESRQLKAGFWKLKSMLKHSDVRWNLAAGIQLHLAGLTDGDESLRRFISNPSQLYLGFEATAAMLDCEDPRTLMAMRAYLKRCLKFFESNDSPGLAYLTGPSCLYLLVHGNESDRGLVARAHFAKQSIYALTFMVDDPLRLTPFLVKVDPDLTRSIGVGFRDRNPEDATWLQRQLFSELSHHYISRFEGLQASRAAYEIDEENQILSSWFLPSSEVVRKLGGFGPKMTRFDPQPDSSPSLMRRTPWLSQPQFVDTYVQNWLNGHANYQAHFDYLESDSITKSVARIGGGATPPAYSLFMLQHQVGRTAWSTAFDRFPMGNDRRSYLFIHNSGSGNFGGINGVAEMHLDFVDSQIEIQVRLTQEAHYDGGAIFGKRVDDWSAWPHHKYVENAGRDLINSIVIRSESKRVHAKLLRQDQDGLLIYRASLPESETQYCYIDVNLSLVDQQQTLTYSLTHGENVRRIRQSISRAFTQNIPNEETD